MKRTIFIYVITFIAGLLCALAASGYLVEEVWENSEDILFGNNILNQISHEYMARNTVETVRALDSNQPERIYELSCINLLVYTDHIKPELYVDSPGRRKEVEGLKLLALETLTALQQSGYCED